MLKALDVSHMTAYAIKNENTLQLIFENFKISNYLSIKIPLIDRWHIDKDLDKNLLAVWHNVAENAPVLRK